MSTDNGVGRVIDQAMRDGPVALAKAQAEADQLNLLDPLGSEEILDARERMGKNASHLSVVREARAARGRAGRPAGARNKRTDDLVAYLSQFGPDPAVAAMRIIATTEELMVERSKSVGDGKRKMTFGEAQAQRMRMIELMMPYFHGKKPVQVDVDVHGDFQLVMNNGQGTAISEILEAEYMPFGDGEEQ